MNALHVVVSKSNSLVSKYGITQVSLSLSNNVGRKAGWKLIVFSAVAGSEHNCQYNGLSRRGTDGPAAHTLLFSHIVTYANNAQQTALLCTMQERQNLQLQKLRMHFIRALPQYFTRSVVLPTLARGTIPMSSCSPYFRSQSRASFIICQKCVRGLSLSAISGRAGPGRGRARRPFFCHHNLAVHSWTL